jgi:hypothetical protein
VVVGTVVVGTSAIAEMLCFFNAALSGAYPATNERRPGPIAYRSSSLIAPPSVPSNGPASLVCATTYDTTGSGYAVPHPSCAPNFADSVPSSLRCIVRTPAAIDPPVGSTNNPAAFRTETVGSPKYAATLESIQPMKPSDTVASLFDSATERPTASGPRTSWMPPVSG